MLECASQCPLFHHRKWEQRSPYTVGLGAVAEVHSQQRTHVMHWGTRRGSPCAGEVGAATEVQAGKREERAQGAQRAVAEAVAVAQVERRQPAQAPQRLQVPPRAGSPAG